MKLSIASDHGGYLLKKQIIEQLSQFNWVDCGCFNTDSCDYPDFAFLAAEMVKNQEVDFGIVICKSGIGMSIAANKVQGIRCALVNDVETAILTRQHNNANMLALGANQVDEKLGIQIIQSFVQTEFLGMQHTRRIEKITKYENQHHHL